MNSFYTDVIQKDSRYNSTNIINDLSLLEPVTRQNVQNIIAAAEARGIRLMVFETYRSQARQQLLFSQGKSELKTVGVHHYGLACDIVKNVGGNPSWDGDFSILGLLAHSNGMIWGGDWGNPHITHSFLDPDHVQRCPVSRQDSLFALTWYPDSSYNPYQDLPAFSTGAAPSPQQ